MNKKIETYNELKHWVRLTKTCNNNCIFCLDKEVQDGSFTSREIIKEELEKGLREGAKRAVLSGGESTLHPKIFKIIKEAKTLGYKKVQIITNGRIFVYENFLNKAISAGLDELTFSIHGHTKELHEQQTQVKGSFAQSIKGLVNAIKSKKLIVSVDVVIGKMNYKYLPEIIKLCYKLGVNEFDLLQITPFGSAWENRDKVICKLEDIYPYLIETVQFSRTKNIRLWTNRFPPEYLEGYEYLIQDPNKIYDEVKGREDIFNSYINGGNIMPCYGDRCSFCFINKFCKELISIYERINMSKVEYLIQEQQINKIPLCVNRNDNSKDEFYTLDIFDENLRIALYKFVKHFIKYRYKVKSLRCNECKLFDKCEGMDVISIRSFGFNILNKWE